MFNNCVIVIEGYEFPIRLFPMPMKECDVVVGMDWLAKYQASIVCNQKMIRIVMPDQRTIVIYGDR